MTPVEEAAAAALRGELVVFPTDTVYGIGSRPDDPVATSRIFDAKRRAEASALPILTASVDAARDVATFDERADRLSPLWPGALTLILPRTAASRAWKLGGDPATIGVRVPRHLLALAVLDATGPLAVSSANRSGEPPAATCEELRAAFGELVSVYLCQEEPLAGAASTVVDLTGTRARIVRAGALDPSRVATVLETGVPLLDSRPPG